MHEMQILNSASMAYAKGDIAGAIGYLVGLAALLDIQLPRPPFPARSTIDTHQRLVRHYFECLRIVNEKLGRKIEGIRLSYSQPFKLVKKEGGGAKK